VLPPTKIRRTEASQEAVHYDLTPARDAEFCSIDAGATFATRLHLNLLTAILASLLERSEGGGRSTSAIRLKFQFESSNAPQISAALEQEEFMAEIRRDEPIGNTGLSTAALAHANEPIEQEFVEKREDGRDLNASVERRLNANSSQPSETDEQAALFSQDESKELYAKWDAVQVGFVDEPRQAVERADSLVAGAMKRLAEMFAEERARLEGQWDRGDDVSTEELRLALRRYRAFFGRLLSV
jgi:hypothetical protein